MISILVSLLAFTLYGGLTNPLEREAEARKTPQKLPSETLELILLGSFTLSGAVGMLYQIAWIRALVLVIGSSTYAFSAILVTFLTGIALGSYIFTRIRNGQTPQFFARLQIGVAISAFLLIPFFSFLPRLFLELFQAYKGSYSYIQFIQFFIVSSVVLLPTTLMGMTFPCLTGILTRKLSTLGRDVGRFYSYNTVGAIAGSILTGFFLVPYVGAQKTLVLGITLNVLMAVSIYWVIQPARRIIHVPATLATLILIFLLPNWNRQVMTSGVSILPNYYSNRIEGKLAGLNPFLKQNDVQYFREGISTTIATIRNPDGIKSLWINGKGAATTYSDDMETLTKIAYIPMLLHPKPERVAIIGLGAGITAGFASQFESTKNIEIIELEPAVVEASRYFSNENFGIMSNPKVNIHLDDGRSYIEGTREKFDVIISQPSNPWISGVSSLFTTEFIEIVKNKLNPDGIFCQWMQGYHIPPEDLKLVLRTFLDVFPEATLWEGARADYILIGRKVGNQMLDLNLILDRLEANPSVLEALNRYGVSQMEEFLTSFRLGSEALSIFAEEGTLNTDDLTLLEFSAPKFLYRDFRLRISREILDFKNESYPSFLQGNKLESGEVHLKLGKYFMSKGMFRLATWEFEKVKPLTNIPILQISTNEEPVFHSSEPLVEIFEDFDGVFQVPLLPHVGTYRPEKSEKEFPVWSTNLDYFVRISGIVKNSGRKDSDGLVINGVEGLASVGYKMPIIVEPSRKYRMEFWLKSRMRKTEEGGVGYLEYDVLIPTKQQLTQAENVQHIVHGKDSVRIKGEHEWKMYAFEFTTAPRTQMVHIFIYREGKPGPGPLILDDISIQAVN